MWRGFDEGVARDAVAPPNPGGGALLFLAPPNPGGGAFEDEDVCPGPNWFLPDGTAEVVANGVKERKFALIGLELWPSEGKSSPECVAAC